MKLKILINTKKGSVKGYLGKKFVSKADWCPPLLGKQSEKNMVREAVQEVLRSLFRAA